MSKFIFIIILFLSSNVFAATYLSCKQNNYDGNANANITIKIENKKIFFNFYNQTLEDWSEHIHIWNDEEIIIKKEASIDVVNKVRKRGIEICMEDFGKSKKYCEQNPYKPWFHENEEKIYQPQIRINRINGDLSKIILDTYLLSGSKLEYSCIVSDKVLF